VTSIRSTVSILVEDEKLDADWQRRFHQNIYDESLRMAKLSDVLMTYLRAPKDVTPLMHDPDDAFSNAEYEVVDTDFAQAAQRCDYDPSVLAKQFDCDLATILRKMACLDEMHPPMGLIVSDASGTITTYKPVLGMSLPRQGGGCPLWPVYLALSQPGQPLMTDVELPGSHAARLRCYAIAQPVGAVAFDAPVVYQSTMLVIADQPETSAPALPIGTACRICPRGACQARRVPSALEQD
jgi:hypothetical protein